MNKIAIIYHSGHGHTEHIAGQILAGAAAVPGTEAELLKAWDLSNAPDRLLAYDGYILGSPTYLGGISAPFKSFIGGIYNGISFFQ